MRPHVILEIGLSWTYAAGRAGKAATPVGPANKGKAPAMPAAPSLASRLGGLPLAQRLGDVKGATNGAGSDL